MIGPYICQIWGLSVGLLGGCGVVSVHETNLFLGSVGVPGIDDGDDAREDPWWSTHEQRPDVVKAEGTGEGWL